MKEILLNNGKHQMKLSGIVLGTAAFGTGIADPDAFWQMDAYLDAGGVTLDTARVYGAWAPGGDGGSEKCIGRWMAARNNRERVFLSTKGAHPEIQDVHCSRMSPENIHKDFEESRSFLGCDYVDLYFLHRDDITLPVSVIMDALDEKVKEGKIHFLGASNWTRARIKEANEYALAHGKTPFSVSQIQWSLGAQRPDAGLDDTLVHMEGAEYQAYLSDPMPVMAFTSQAKGFFSKLQQVGEEGLSEFLRKAYLDEKNLARFQRAKALAAEKNVPISAVVLAAITSNPLDGVAIISTSKREQLTESLSGRDLVLTPEEVAFLWG